MSNNGGNYRSVPGSQQRQQQQQPRVLPSYKQVSYTPPGAGAQRPGPRAVTSDQSHNMSGSFSSGESGADSRLLRVPEIYWDWCATEAMVMERMDGIPVSRIDALRAKTVCVEDPQFTKDYHDPARRSIANALTIEFADGSKLAEVAVEFPIGHQRRRADGIPLLVDKFRTNLARRFPAKQQQAILDVSLDQAKLEAMPVDEYVDLYVI